MGRPPSGAVVKAQIISKRVTPAQHAELLRRYGTISNAMQVALHYLLKKEQS